MSIQTVAGEYLVPQVGRAILARRCGRIARAVIAPAIEGQKPRLTTGKPRRHPDLVRVHSEVHQRPFLETKERLARVAIFLVLPLSVFDRLPRHLVLELDRHHRQSVHGQDDIDRLMRVPLAEMHLSVHAQGVLAVVRQRLGSDRYWGGKTRAARPSQNI